ncbi:MASE1 domain-containing protein [Frateuria hangzhouensis]|uniref:MASE1 domain-containing protein n=1 Tax=Frateuria hangzhouensis TaxID=2995589 RepID=UPI002260AB64|nr:MASE1 domain-containing protein [Frateuria sp. STR12]MCX7512846.1 MASE1 domain-containing protein [Frateuria sp. STR12]
MLARISANAWLQHIAVAVAYALVFALLREVSFSHWFLFAGLRFGALLLVPYRYWPALLIGEAGPLAYTAIECAGQYGWLWGAFFMVPPMLFAMPVAAWCRRRHRLFPTRASTNINVFLLSTLVVSVIWTALNMATLSLMQLPPGEALPYQGEVAGWYFVGFFLGILTVVPLVLLVREELLTAGLRQLWSRFSESRLVMDTVCLLLPSLALLVWLASSGAGAASQEARVAMFLPVVLLSLRHGWRGAAVGGTAASIAVVLTMPKLYDNNTLHAQVFIAFTITTMMMLGGRIAVLHEREKRDKADAQLALAVAQRNIYLGEMQLRQTSFALEQMSGAIQASYTQLLGRLRCLMPGTDERSYYRQAAVTQHQMYRLADSLYPLSWRERGLPAALREGSMPRALDEAGITYWCDIHDAGLSELSTSIHMTLYRLACEAVALACAKRNVSGIRMRLRSGSFKGRRWAVLCVDSHVDYERLARVRWDELIPALGGSGLGVGALKDRATVFNGKVRVRSLADSNRISLILFEPDLV